MKTAFAKDRRHFRRYLRESIFDIPYKNSSFKAKTIDYSLNGIGLYVEDPPPLGNGDILDVLIAEPEIKASGHIMWSVQEGRSLKLGLRLVKGLKGRIKDFKFADILIGLQRSQKTGILSVEAGDTVKKLFIKNGDIVFSASNRTEDRLGDLLLKEGRITLEQYNHSVEELKRSTNRQGEILLRLGYLKDDELISAVRHQVEEIILSIFELEHGRFNFSEMTLPTDEIITLKLSAATLIYNGVLRIKSFYAIRQDLPSLDSILFFSKDPLDLFQDINFDAAGRRLIACIDGTKSIHEVINSSGLHELNAIKIVYALLNIRLLEVSARPGQEASDQEQSETIREEIIEEMAESAESSQLREMIEDVYARYKNLEYYEMLNISKQASPAEIRKAYYASAKKYHPDRHFRFADDSMRSKLSSIFSYVNEAYSALSDPRKRSDYDRLSSAHSSQSVSPQDRARTAFAKGKDAFDKDDLEEAALFFSQAIYFVSDNAELHYYHALTQIKQKKLKEAARSLENALKLEPSNAVYITDLGSVF